MKLRNPPIVEAWIDFRFAHEPGTDATAADRAERLLRGQFGEELPDVGHLVEEVFADPEPRPGRGDAWSAEVRHRVAAVRAASPTRTEVVQMGPGFVSVHFLRPSGGEYPGYETLRDRAYQLLDAYVEEFRPSRLLSFGLHSVNVVDIPPEGGSVDLSEWFRFDVTLPTEGFVSAPHGVTVDCRVRVPIEGVELRFLVSNEDGPPDSDDVRFRLEWHLDGRLDAAPDESGLSREILDAAHEYRNRSFRATFTEKAWARFEEHEESPAA